MPDSKSLIGYFLVDISFVVSTCQWPLLPCFEGLKGNGLDTKSSKRGASKYYETITKPIRRMTRSHLILGDRYNVTRASPSTARGDEAIRRCAVDPNNFSGSRWKTMSRDRDSFAEWHEITGKPVLNADLGNWTATSSIPTARRASPRSRAWVKLRRINRHACS